MYRLALVVCAGCGFGVETSTDVKLTDRVRAIDIVDAKVITSHGNFPLLVSLTEPWLRSVANGGDVVNDSGIDIRFSAEPGSNVLAHEIERYDPVDGALLAWVSVPMLTPATVFYLHYGDTTVATSTQNPSRVWASYSGVWHLDDDHDSTTKNTAAVTTGPIATAGKIGGARQFTAAGDNIDIGAGAAIADVFAEGGTVEAWIRPSGWGGGNVARIVDKQAPKGWVFEIEGVGGDLAFFHSAAVGNGFWNTPTGLVVLDRARHVAVTFDKRTGIAGPAFFVDGARVTTNPTTFNPGGALDSDASIPARIGNNSSGNRTWDGWIDEVRLSPVSRAPEWLDTTYRNHSDPASFYTVGPELTR